MDSSCLASYVVFRELYDNKEMDVYDIIASFATAAIVSASMHSFTPGELTRAVNTMYGFGLPENVVKTSIGRLEHVQSAGNNLYQATVAAMKKESEELGDKRGAALLSSDWLLELLVEHVAKARKTSVNGVDRESLISAFCTFLLDGDGSFPFSKDISSFVVANESNGTVMSALESIREGAILYSGLNYNVDLSIQKNWPLPLNVYLDQEILFYFAGYNGSTYQEMVQDFLDLVRELNKRSGNNLKLLYLSDVRQRITEYFQAAEGIVAGKRLAAHDSSNAMRSILSGCKSESDVVEKHNRFFVQLRQAGIHESTNEPDLFADGNYGLNLESEELVKKYDIDDSKYKSLRYLNRIHHLRKGVYKYDLQLVGSILLSETRLTRTIAADIAREEKEGSVPLAIGLQAFTNRLWYDLNKGFGAKNFPKSLGVLVKAKVILASVLGQSISLKYQHAKERYSKGELDDEVMKATIVALRLQNVKPEEINEENVQDIVDSIVIDEADIEAYRDNYLAQREEHEATKKEVNEWREKATRLSADHSEAAQVLLESRQDQIEIVSQAKDLADRKTRAALSSVRLAALLVLVLIGVGAYVAGANDLPFLRGALALMGVAPIASYVVSLISPKQRVSSTELFRKLEGRIQARYYRKFRVDIVKLNTLIAQVESQRLCDNEQSIHLLTPSEVGGDDVF